MKKYIDAQLQVVRIKTNDILTVSGLGISGGTNADTSYGDAADRFRDFDVY